MDSGYNGLVAPTRDELIGMLDRFARQHPLCCHPYIDRVCDMRSYDPAGVNRFAEVIYRVDQELRDGLLALASTTRFEDIRVALLTDLYHEYGAGVIECSRAFSMRKLLSSLGYTEFTPIRLNDETRVAVERVGSYCREEPPLRALGFAWLGADRSRFALFQRLSNAFKKQPSLRSADLSAFEVENDDVERSIRAVDIISPFMNTSEGRRLLQEGLLDSARLFEELWASMLRQEIALARTTQVGALV